MTRTPAYFTHSSITCMISCATQARQGGNSLYKIAIWIPNVSAPELPSRSCPLYNLSTLQYFKAFLLQRLEYIIHLILYQET